MIWKYLTILKKGKDNVNIWSKWFGESFETKAKPSDIKPSNIPTTEPDIKRITIKDVVELHKKPHHNNHTYTSQPSPNKDFRGVNVWNKLKKEKVKQVDWVLLKSWRLIQTPKNFIKIILRLLPKKIVHRLEVETLRLELDYRVMILH